MRIQCILQSLRAMPPFDCKADDLTQRMNARISSAGAGHHYRLLCNLVKRLFKFTLNGWLLSFLPLETMISCAIILKQSSILGQD